MPPTAPVVASGAGIIPVGAGIVGDSFFAHGPIDVGLLDNNPRAVFRHAPTPPREVHDRAEVTVEFIVDRNGRVVDVRILHADSAVLEASCLQAVRRWRFEPGTKDGIPVAFRVQQTFVFNAAE